MSSHLLASSTHNKRRRTSDGPTQWPVRHAAGTPSRSHSSSTSSPESCAAFEALLAETTRLLQASKDVLLKIQQADLERWTHKWTWFDEHTQLVYNLARLDELRERLRFAPEDLQPRERHALDDVIHRLELAFYTDKRKMARKLREDSAWKFISEFRDCLHEIGWLTEADRPACSKLVREAFQVACGRR